MRPGTPSTAAMVSGLCFPFLGPRVTAADNIDIGTAVETLVTDRWAARKTAAHPTSIGVPSNPRDVTPKYCYTNG